MKHTMIANLRTITFLLGCSLLVGALVVGCKRAPVQSKKDPEIGEIKGKFNPFTTAFESFRFPENAAGTDDVGRFRDGLQVLGANFSKTDIRLDADERKFLTQDAHLSEAELAEVESPS